MRLISAADAKPAARESMAGMLYRRSRLLTALALVLCLGFAGTATAVSSSDNYQVVEPRFGTGGSLNDCSGTYCARTATGDAVAGSISSDNYGAQTGSNTTDEPTLEVLVTGSSHELGTLSSGTTATAAATIAVRSYLNTGYVMQINGEPPSRDDYTLAALSPQDCPCTSQPGAEQFGINLADNSAPDVGADPVQLPEGGIYGQAESTYAQSNLFAYENGAVVAEGVASSGQTVYTMSMILNISNTTPGGYYQTTLSAVVIPVY